MQPPCKSKLWSALQGNRFVVPASIGSLSVFRLKALLRTIYFYPQHKGTNIDRFITQLFESGLYKPAGVLLAGCFLASLIGGLPVLIGLPAILFAINVVVSAYPE